MDSEPKPIAFREVLCATALVKAKRNHENTMPALLIGDLISKRSPSALTDQQRLTKKVKKEDKDKKKQQQQLTNRETRPENQGGPVKLNKWK